MRRDGGEARSAETGLLLLKALINMNTDSGKWIWRSRQRSANAMTFRHGISWTFPDKARKSTIQKMTSIRMKSVQLTTCVLMSLAVSGGISSCTRTPVHSKKLDTALILAAKRGDTSDVQSLLKRGANIEAKDQGGETPLAISADFGHADTVKLLLEKGADPVAGQIAGDEALIKAAGEGNANKVDLLLERGTSLKARNAALFEVGESEPGVVVIVDPSFAEQAQRRQKEEPYGTVKFPAWDSAETARLLLDHGADIEARREDGATPLMQAASHGSTSVVKVLLDRGALLEARDNDGGTALIDAACSCAVATMPGTYDSMELLLGKGANGNAKRKDGSTALMAAAGWGRTDNVKLLLDNRATVDACDAEGNTALLIGSSGSALDTTGAVQVLLAGGANVAARNKNGETALILAASQRGFGNVGIAKILLRSGADVNARDNHGHTALDLAIKNGYSEMISLLKRGRNSSARGKGNLSLR